MQELIEKVAKFPKLPGVYIMKDAAGEVIYVGKAKELRARVRSYFTGADERRQIAYLLSRINHIDTVITENEMQALVLERDLITKYKPRYNIRLKDDKAFLSIRVDTNAQWPRLELVRKRVEDGARYFGPYSFSYELRTLLELIKKSIPLRTCSDTVFFNRTRPCLEYQIKRCSGPCCLPVSPEQYEEWVSYALKVLEGKVEPLIKELNEKMERASEALQFEEAAKMRDTIETLTNWKKGTSIISSRDEDRDVIGYYREERFAAVSILKVRSGRVMDGANFRFDDVVVPDDELIDSVITQYYVVGRDIPSEIITPMELVSAETLSEYVTMTRGQKVSLMTAERGIKARLLALAQTNAKEHFSSSFDGEARYKDIAEKLAKVAELKQIPRRIECIDISNLQGSDIVGALVSFQDGEPLRSAYRKYKIRTVENAPNDFASIYEVVSRRLTSGMRDEDLPDLLIIDGGQAQLNQALKAKEDVGAAIEIISLAKARSFEEQGQMITTPERIYIPHDETPRALDPKSELTKFVARVRDEVHRFVITFHRATRAKRAVRSKLDEIRGVSPQSRMRLLKSFGSVEDIKNASAEEVAKQGRMPLSLAKKVLSNL
jgi:excinuclease ABC subunit C